MSAGLDVVIVGAGVVGMAAALTLVDHGHRVTVVDAASGPGMGASHANGAQLSYAYTDALASPATIAQLPRLLFAADPAFRLHPRLDPAFLRWGTAFLRNARRSRFLDNTLAGIELAVRSRAALHALAARHQIAFAHRAPGKIHLYRSAPGFAAAQEIAAVKRRHGITQTVLDADGAVAIEPMLAAVRGHIAGALHTPDEEVGDPHLFCTGARLALIGTGRCTMIFGATVERLIPGACPAIVADRGRRIAGDRVILCAGVDSPRLARTLGARLPILPMKGYSITAAPGPAAPGVSITDVSNRVVFARLGDRMRIAGLADLGNGDCRVDPKRLAALVASARAALPDAADYDALQSSWAGLRPMTPDSLPIIRPIAQGVIANTGHGALGWTYAAGSAQRVAELIEQGSDGGQRAVAL